MGEHTAKLVSVLAKLRGSSVGESIACAAWQIADKIRHGLLVPNHVDAPRDGQHLILSNSPFIVGTRGAVRSSLSGWGFMAPPNEDTTHVCVFSLPPLVLYWLTGVRKHNIMQLFRRLLKDSHSTTLRFTPHEHRDRMFVQA